MKDIVLKKDKSSGIPALIVLEDQKKAATIYSDGMIEFSRKEYYGTQLETLNNISRCFWVIYNSLGYVEKMPQTYAEPTARAFVIDENKPS